MKKLIAFLSFVLFLSRLVYSQGVGIGTTTPNSSALLDLQSTNKGLLLPRVTTTQRNAIASPVAGLLVFDTDKSTIYMYDGVQWLPLTAGNSAILQTSRTSNTPTDNAGFGYKVCLSGNYAVISSHNNSGNSIDTVFIFSKTTGTWLLQTKLVQSDPVAGDYFGESVAISGDYILVGAPRRNSATGAVYAFSRSGNNWTQTAIITAASPQTYSHFGNTISVDGLYALIGAPFFYTNVNVKKGCVYNFYRNGLGWQQQQQLYGISSLEDFGESIAISGIYALVGAPYAAYNGIENCGIAYFFKRTGVNWAIIDTIYNENGIENDFFGAGVAISNTNNWAFIGSPGGFLGDNNSSHVHAYFISVDKLSFIKSFSCPTPNTTLNGQGYGATLSMYNDFLLVGAPYIPNDDGEEGAVYIYKHKANQSFASAWSLWKIVKEMNASPSSPSIIGGYGRAIFINGYNIVMGNPTENTNQGKVIFLNIE